MQQEDDGGGQTWLVIQPDRSDSRGHRDSKRRGRSEDEASNISISIGPDNSVSVDSGHSRRIMR